jgi:hypothetical protein
VRHYLWPFLASGVVTALVAVGVLAVGWLVAGPILIAIVWMVARDYRAYRRMRS